MMPRMIRRRALWLGVAALMAAAGPATVAAATSRGTVTGKITGLPAGAVSLGVEAVDGRGVIGAIGPLGAGGSYRLTPPAGSWIVVATATSGDEPFSALSVPVRVRGHRTATVKPTRAKQQASAAAVTRLKPGSVVTVDRMTLQDERAFSPGGSYTDITATVTNDLFRACSSRGITFVDSSPAFTSFARQESNLSRAGRLKTPFSFHPLKLKYSVEPFNGATVEGEAGVISTSDVSIHLAIDYAGSFLGVGRSFNGPNLDVSFASVPDEADVLGVVHREDAALAQRMC